MVHTYSGSELNRAAIRRLDDDWLKSCWDSADAQFVCFAAERPMVNVAGANGPEIRWPAKPDPDARLEDAIFLGLDDEEHAVFGISLALDDEGEPCCGRDDATKLIDLRSLAAQGVLTQPDLSILAQTRSMLGWHQSHRFCAACGKQSASAEGGYKRKCPSCGREHFPRTDPVVIIVVRHGDDCLLGRSPHFPEGSYSALAGFMEPGETIEEAARREILEESGVIVGDVHYHSSQPWPFPSSLMIGLIGEATTRELTLDPAEIDDARWFPREEVALMLTGDHPEGVFTPPPFAIAHHLITAFVEGG